jgi:hypothetical protein
MGNGQVRNVTARRDENPITYAENDSWSVDLKDGRLSEILLRFAISVTATSGEGGGTVSGHLPRAIANLLSPSGLKIMRGAIKVLDLKLDLLYMISALRAGRIQMHDTLAPTIGATSTGSVEISLPTKPLTRPGIVNVPGIFAWGAYGANFTLEGQFGADSDFASTNVDSIIGKLTFSCEEKPTKDLILQPKVMHRNNLVNSSTSKLTLPRIDFDKDFLLEGIYLVTKDGDLSGDSQYVNGLVTSLKAELTTPRGGVEYSGESRFAILRQATMDLHEIDDADMLNGIVFLDMALPQGPMGLREVPAGSKLSIDLNTSETVDQEFSDVTPDGDCTIDTIIMGWEQVDDSAQAAA